MTAAATRLVHQVRMEQLVYWRNFSGVFFTFVFPLLLLAFFGAGIGRSSTTSGVDYREFLAPGIVAVAVVSTCFQSLAISLSFHREQGILKRLRATPMSPALLIAAKVVSMVLIALLLVLVVIAGSRIVFDIAAPEHFAAVMMWCILGAATSCALGIAIAGAIPRADVAPAITNAIYLPMLFISGVFYDVTKLPTALEYIALALPMAHLAEGIRHAWNDTALSPNEWVNVAVLLAWLAVGTVWSLRRFRWEPSHET